MNKEELKSNLDKVKKQILNNSKDAHFAENLIQELLSIKGQLSVEPLEFNVGRKISEWGNDKFSFVETDRGVLYKERNNFAVFSSTNYSMYSAIKEIIEELNSEYFKNKSEEDKESFFVAIHAIVHCLGVPKLAFSDAAFMYDMATNVIKYIESLQEQAQEQDVQAETPAEDKAYEDHILAMEDISTALKEEYKK